MSISAERSTATKVRKMLMMIEELERTKEPNITIGSPSRFYRWDKTWSEINSDWITQGLTNKFMTDAEKTKLASLAAPSKGVATLAFSLLASPSVAITIPGATATSIALCQLTTVIGGLSVSQILGASPAVTAVCTTNTLTITGRPALTLSGNVGINYLVFL